MSPRPKQVFNLLSAIKEMLLRGHPVAVFGSLGLLQALILYSSCFYVLFTKNNRHLPEELISLLPSLKRYQAWGEQVGLSPLVNELLIAYAGCLFIHAAFVLINTNILLIRYKLNESAPLKLNTAIFVVMLVITIIPNFEIIWGPIAIGQPGLFSNSLFSGNETLSYFRYAPLAFSNFFLFILLGGARYRYPTSDWQSRKL